MFPHLFIVRSAIGLMAVVASHHHLARTLFILLMSCIGLVGLITISHVSNSPATITYQRTIRSEVDMVQEDTSESSLIVTNVSHPEYSHSFEPDPVEKRSKPAVGVVYYFHIHKTGGTHLQESLQNMSQNLSELEQILWAREGKTFAEIEHILEDLSNSEYNNQLTVIQHHHRYPPAIEMMPLLLEHKAAAEARGFTFDIICTVRDSASLVVSYYNYSIQIHEFNVADVAFREFIQTIANLNLVAIFKSTPAITFIPDTSTGIAYQDWKLRAQRFVDQVDYFFFTDELDTRFLAYFEGKYHIPFTPLPFHGNSGTVKSKTMESLTYEELMLIYQNHAADEQFLDCVRRKNMLSDW